MNENLIVISDLHLDVWLRNNPDGQPEYRMRTQPMKLAERLTDVMKEYKTNYLIIAGDIINSWNVQPKVMQVLWDFYTKLITDNPDIYIGYIVAQHDSRNYHDNSFDNSYVHAAIKMFPNNVHYVHEKELNLNGTSIYISNYSRTTPYYPPHYCDVWISHVPLGFVELNSPNYSLGVFGDIHNIYDNGKDHSICPPFQLHAHEYRYGKIGLIRLKGKLSTFERLDSDTPHFQFLKLERTIHNFSTQDKQEETGLKLEEREELSKDNVMDMIDEEVKKYKLNHIHALIDKEKIPPTINFNFKIHKIVIDNVRSIEHLELDFDKLEGITYLRAENGAGKSSIFYAISTAFTGDKKMLNEKMIDAKGDMRIQLWMDYDGSKYYIDRWENNNLAFTKDGEKIQLGKRATQPELEKYIPWINYFNYFYLKPNSQYFGNLDKTEFMKVLFNLTIFDYLSTEAQNRAKMKEKEVRANNKEITALEAKSQSLEQLKSDYEKQLKAIDLKYKKSDLESSKDLFNQYNLICVEKSTKLSTAKEQLAKYEKETSEFKGVEINSNIVQLALDTYNSAEDVNKGIEELERQLRSLKGELDYCKSSVKTCPNCGKQLSGSTPEEIQEKEKGVKRLQDKLDATTKIDLTKLWDDYSTKKKQLADYKANEAKLNSINSLKLEIELNQSGYDNAHEVMESLAKKFNTDCDNFLSVVDKYLQNHKEALVHEMNIQKLGFDLSSVLLDKSKLEKVNEEATKLAEDYQKYSDLFNVATPNSIPYTIMARLVSHLNNEMIKFESTKEGSDDFDINAYINVDGKWIDYHRASSGQKALLDQFILIRITSFVDGVGLTLLDECYVNLSEDNLENAVKLLKDIKSDKIMIASHTDLFSNYDNLLNIRRINGKTLVEGLNNEK